MGDSTGKKLLITHRPTEDEHWYDLQLNEVSADKWPEVEQLRLQAQTLLERDEQLAKKSREKKRPGETNWLKTASDKGTLSDKQAAMMLQIQESPVHSLSLLDSLLNTFKQPKRRESSVVMDTLKDLFIHCLLPADRKLVTFDHRDMGKLAELSKERDKHTTLVYWYFEEQLKCRFETFVKNVEHLCHDSVESTRIHAVRVLCDLLAERPEQEQFLLESIVNKIGDSKQKVADKVCTSLSKVLQTHPKMNVCVVTQVERLIYRPNISERAQFYGVHFLSQIVLHANESELAVKLLNIYFNLFRLIVSKDKMQSRMFAVLLAGTNRAFPYAKNNVDQLLKEMEVLYRVVGVAPLGTALQTLLLLFQVLEASEGVSDRFYCALYRRLWDPALQTAAGKHAQLLQLLTKTLKADAVDRRVTAFIKRLLQLALQETPSFAGAVLLLVGELVKDRPAVLPLTKQAQLFTPGLNDDEEEHYVDVPDIDVDSESDHKHVLVKQEPLDNVKAEVHLNNGHVDEKGVQDDTKPNTKSASGWLHKTDTGNRMQHAYDVNARNPLFCGAHYSLCYELCLLARHYHPSVRLFANRLLRDEPIEYSGDALQDFTMMRFLDRFVYRNPKQNEKKNSDKTEQTQIIRRSKSYVPTGVKTMSVLSEEYTSQARNKIPVDEKYLHRYLSSIGKMPKPKKSAKKDEADFSDNESVQSEEFDEIIDRFEPGAANDEFEIDFTREFGKTRDKDAKGEKKRKRVHSSDQSDQDEEEFSDMSDDEESEDNMDDEHAVFASADKFGSMLSSGVSSAVPKWQRKLQHKDSDATTARKTNKKMKRK